MNQNKNSYHITSSVQIYKSHITSPLEKPNGYHAGLRIKLSGFKSWMESLGCVLKKDTFYNIIAPLTHKYKGYW